ncbi:MAG TPA: BON domain-containing protein, partial [Polyangiaceae bacterium]|nr:BON domain-containing protein [Polyangiaceae bacterium]
MTKKTDADIRQAVQHELREDRRISEPGLNVVVDEGIVTLTGEVSSWGKRQAAQEAAHRVGGVLDVANEIRVKPPNSARRSDTEI